MDNPLTGLAVAYGRCIRDGNNPFGIGMVANSKSGISVMVIAFSGKLFSNAGTIRTRNCIIREGAIRLGAKMAIPSRGAEENCAPVKENDRLMIVPGSMEEVIQGAIT